MPTYWNIPLVSGETLPLPVTVNSQLFILGPNGSGKSALIQHAVTALGPDNIRRISAHRQTWLESGNIDMTPQSRRQFADQLRGHEPNIDYRWKEYNSQGQLSSVLFDLTAMDNDLARRIRDHAYAKQQEEVERIVNHERPVFARINDLLHLSGLAVSIENSAGEEILARHRDATEPYSIARMSDGERNAVIIAANVLTAKGGTVLLIDEPERHLHRSIIEPFLSTLFAQRPDCTFIVSTHETALPMANPDQPVLMVRSCRWNGATPGAWDAALLEKNTGLPEDLKRAILGARKSILFVEGEPQSLDLPLYGALFPDISIIPAGGCDDVIKAVSGLNDSQNFHDVTAIGLIDRDNRNDDEVGHLQQRGIYALDAYSVESLYYCVDSREAVACWQEKSFGHDASQMMTAAQLKVRDALMDDNLAERMAARHCERTIRAKLQSRMPGWQEIRDNLDRTISTTVESSYQDELHHFRELVSNGLTEEVISRYPIRETSIPHDVARTFGLAKKDYEKMLVARVMDSPDLAEKLRQRLKPLWDAVTA